MNEMKWQPIETAPNNKWVIVGTKSIRDGKEVWLWVQAIFCSYTITFWGLRKPRWFTPNSKYPELLWKPTHWLEVRAPEEE